MKPIDYLFGCNWIDQAQRALRDAHFNWIDGGHGLSALPMNDEIINDAWGWARTVEGQDVWADRYDEMREECY